MSTYLVTWNPDKYPFNELPKNAARLRQGKRVTQAWSCGKRRDLEPGSRLFLLRQGRRGWRGIIGSGYAIGTPRLGDHYDPSLAALGRTLLYVPVEWDTLLVPGSDLILSRSYLNKGALRRINWQTRSGGIVVRPDAAEEIERLWSIITALVGSEERPQKPSARRGSRLAGGGRRVSLSKAAKRGRRSRRGG